MTIVEITGGLLRAGRAPVGLSLEDSGRLARIAAPPELPMARSPDLRRSYDRAPPGCFSGRRQMTLHFAEFQGSTCACCPFRLSIVGKILPLALRRFLVPTSSL